MAWHFHAMHHLPILAVDVLTPETLVPAGAVGAVILLAVGGARAYEALRSRQDTHGQDLEAVDKKIDRVAGDLIAAKDRSDKRHEDLVHRVSITESREAVHDQKMANVEGHLRQQDVKLDRIDDKLDRVLMRDEQPRRRGHGDAA